MKSVQDAANRNQSGRFGRTRGGVEMIKHKKDGNRAIVSEGRRTILKAGATVASALVFGRIAGRNAIQSV
jgi:hypothetical protein